MKIVVYVLCYNETSIAQAGYNFSKYPWARILPIPTTHKYMEGIAYLELLGTLKHEWEDADFVGTLSYKAAEKITIPDMGDLCTRVAEADVIALLPQIQFLVAHACQCHPRFLEVWVPLLLELGYQPADCVNASIPFFACNYWLARPRWMLRFMDFYRRATLVLDTHPALQEALWSDSMYGISSMSENDLVKVYGKPYMPHHPFIGERLACFYFWKERAVVAMIPLASEQFVKQVMETEVRAAMLRAQRMNEISVRDLVGAAAGKSTLL